jgi:hypothetical protein
MKTIDEKLAVYRACLEGKIIVRTELSTGHKNNFAKCKSIIWDWDKYDFDIKPEPKKPREWLLSEAGLTETRMASPYHASLHGIHVIEVLPEAEGGV